MLLKAPGRQGRHIVELFAPRAGPYLPEVQEAQELAKVAPATVLYRPAEQLVQAEAPAELYAPAGHKTQAAGALAKLPAGQDVAVKAQVDAPSMLYAPAPQGPQDAAPAELKVPALQSAHVVALVAPTAALDLPAAQGEHCAWPADCWYEPAAQLVHAAAPTRENVPAPHSTQALAAVLPLRGLYLPALHCTQAAAPAKPNAPAGHAAQVVEPCTLNHPGTQHAPAPALLLKPAAQGRHASPLTLPTEGPYVPAAQRTHADELLAPMAGL